MFQWAKDWVVDKVYGAASTAIQAGGSMAGNTVGSVGTMIENSGRGVGESTSGAIGGWGNYVNSYGEGIINATAASGGGNGAAKKTAVKPSNAVAKTTSTAQKPASAAKSLPSSASKALPAASSTPAAKRTPPPKAAPAKAPPAKKTGAKSAPATTARPKISASAADKTPDSKVRINPASRPQPARAGPQTASSGVKKTTQNNSGPRPLPKISSGKNDRTPDGKIKISPASRPKPVKAA